MTEGLAVLGAVLLAAASVWAFRTWGWPALVGLWTLAASVVAAFWARTTPEPIEPVRPWPPAPSPDAIRAQERAERAREAAERLQADVDASGDAEALTAHLVARSKGET